MRENIKKTDHIYSNRLQYRNITGMGINLFEKLDQRPQQSILAGSSLKGDRMVDVKFKESGIARLYGSQ